MVPGNPWYPISIGWKHDFPYSLMVINCGPFPHFHNMMEWFPYVYSNKNLCPQHFLNCIHAMPPAHAANSDLPPKQKGKQQGSKEANTKAENLIWQRSPKCMFEGFSMEHNEKYHQSWGSKTQVTWMNSENFRAKNRFVCFAHFLCSIHSVPSAQETTAAWVEASP